MKNQTKEGFKQNGKIGVGIIVKIVDSPITSTPMHRTINGINYKKEILHNKTYEEIVKIGESSEAFKFIPYGIEIFIKGKMRLLKDSESFSDDMFIC